MTRTASRLDGQPDILAGTGTGSAAGPSDPRGRRSAILRRGQKRIAPKRIGIYGLFGCGNSGLDGSLEAMLGFLRQLRPDAELVCICSGPQHVTRELGLPAVGLGFTRPANAQFRVLLEIPRKLGSFLRAIWYARRLNLLTVPGGGVLEDFKEQPFVSPLTLFTWCLAAWLCGASIAFVSIGAGPIRNPISRWLLKSAAALADYRSYRDEASKAYMASLGFDVRNDAVYPDLAFNLPVPSSTRASGPNDGPLTIGIGVMAYHGWLKRSASAAVYASYLEKLQAFVLWLLDRGHRVRILTGDVIDRGAVNDFTALVTAERPDLPPGRLLVEPPDSFHDLMRKVAETDLVVATRFHNVICALKLAKPTIAVGYGDKFEALMSDMGLGSFCQPIARLDLDLLMDQFTRLASDRQRHEQRLRDANLAYRARLEQQNLLLASRFL